MKLIGSLLILEGLFIGYVGNRAMALIITFWGIIACVLPAEAATYHYVDDGNSIIHEYGPFDGTNIRIADGPGVDMLRVNEDLGIWDFSGDGLLEGIEYSYHASGELRDYDNSWNDFDAENITLIQAVANYEVWRAGQLLSLVFTANGFNLINGIGGFEVGYLDEQGRRIDFTAEGHLIPNPEPASLLLLGLGLGGILGRVKRMTARTNVL